MGKVEILRAGPLTSVQDLGRAERREGVSAGGALDLCAARVANLIEPVGVGEVGEHAAHVLDQRSVVDVRAAGKMTADEVFEQLPQRVV